jgi:hypothetical protein
MAGSKERQPGLVIEAINLRDEKVSPVGGEAIGTPMMVASGAKTRDQTSMGARISHSPKVSDQWSLPENLSAWRVDKSVQL